MKDEKNDSKYNPPNKILTKVLSTGLYSSVEL